MHRCGSAFLLTLAITFVIAFTGCLGKSTSNPESVGVQSVSLSPSSTLSLETGGTLVFSATAKDASGHIVLGVNIQFIVESGNPNGSAPLSIASNGSACAGTWDATITMCAPGTPGIALVRAVANGFSSQVTTVYVHQHIDSIQISSLTPSGPPQQQYDCFSQGQTWNFGANAYSNNVDITDTVGPITWSASNLGVVTFATSATVSTLQANQVQTTAKAPGITQLLATVSGNTSSPFPYTTCLIQAIHLQIGGQPQAGNSITVNSGSSVSVTATAVDTLYHIANITALTGPPLTWSTTNPEVAAFTTTTNSTGSNSATTRTNLGGATITASCTPFTCNIGVLPSLPIYASDGMLPNGTMGYGAISVNVTSTSTTKPPTYTAWAATTGCQDAPGCSSAMFAVSPGVTPIGTLVDLPRTPNSMMFNHVAAARVYFGTNEGLMYVDVTATNPSVAEVSNLPTPCNVSLCGKVLTISNDGKLVVVSDTVSTPSQVYIFNTGTATVSAPVDLIIPGDTAVAAAFSPDQLKLFILTSTGKMYVYSTVDALTSVPIATSVTDVKFSTDGTFAYVAGNPAANSISGFATCDNQPTHTTSAFDFVTTPGIPLQLFPSPDGQHVLALDPPNGSIDMFTTTIGREALPDGQFVCNAQPQPPFADIDPSVNFPSTAQSFDLGQGKNFVPIYSQLVADGTALIIVARHLPAVLLFNVSNGTTTSVPLVGNSDPLSASASTDGSQIYVAACDQYPNNDPTQPCAAGSVHIVNTVSQGDFQQVTYVNVNNANNPNMCNNQGANAPICLPDLIAIQPK